MHIKRYFASVAVASYLALLSTVAVVAQTNGGGSCSGDVQVKSQADLDPLKPCKKYTGSIVIDKTAANDLKLPGVMQIDGEINIHDNNALTRLSFPHLQAVNSLKLENNRALNKLDLSALTTVHSLEVAVHPALPEISFPAGLSQMSRVTISDTTVTRIDGLKIDKADEIVIDNNIYLRTLDVGNLTEVTKSMSISANSPDLTLDVSHLHALQQGSFRNLAGISMGSLDKVSGDLSFISNKFTSLELPKVTDVGGTFTLSNNNNLEKLSVPELRHLGGALSVGNNTRLTQVNAFAKLEEVDGTLDLTGSFDEVKLPQLQDVSKGNS
ncbi:hypothetical protein BDB00DRAFT_887253 [Zychaea mexicana]|uniref:uncharacterized protein n=1 Tax=Zychaea mexicana TaxID=64656 RepID=UPI0022FE5153|nr:uncharacterized protein BDB00DRAFT_887253 [Zychaea mexicana]KAI9488631.1 hypothetical protein BDB00DRAFT_887253 [Zychaea mexicana]